MSFTQTQAFDDACLVGGVLAALDAGANPAYAIIYQGTTELVTLVFTKPAAVLVNHRLEFDQADASGDLIHTQGDADNFKLFSGENVLFGTGDVTDAAGTGAMKITGTTGTRFYAGARAILDEFTIG